MTIATDRPSHLWERLPGDRRACGVFDDLAYRRSVHYDVLTHRGLTALGTAVTGSTSGPSPSGGGD